MTPKEKAKELCDRFFNINDKDLESKGCNPFIDKYYARQCALVCVEEILNLDYFSEEGRDYWEEVKIEIEGL